MFKFNILKPYTDRIDQGVIMDLSEIEGAVMANQVHGDEILEINEKPNELPNCDAFMTEKIGLPIMAKVADCQGVLMYDPVTHKAAAVHSGWRGSTVNIIGKTIEKMRDRFGVDPKGLRIAISPSLGPCCAEFSDPKNELPEFIHPFVDETNHVDFWSLSEKQCQDAGVPAEQIEVVRKCTKSDPGYYSHRNGDKERMGVFIMLK